MPFTPADEGRHSPAAEPSWQEAWVFELWSVDGVAAFTWCTLIPRQQRVWYWAVLVRPGRPLLHLSELHLALPRSGLELRGEALWATHDCEEPFEQWTVANEAYAVALDDPAETLGRAYGRVEPVAFDVEWYAAGPTEALEGAEGYRQAGRAHAVIEVAGGPVELADVAAARAHWWGTAPPGRRTVAELTVSLLVDGSEPTLVHRGLGADGWTEWRERAGGQSFSRP